MEDEYPESTGHRAAPPRRKKMRIKDSGMPTVAECGRSKKRGKKYKRIPPTLCRRRRLMW